MLEQLWQLCVITAGLLCIYLTVYRAAFSPLANIPGPWYTRLTDTWLMIQEFTSNRREYIHELHRQYGPIVRLGPNEVAFTSLESIKEIYTSGGSGYEKTEFYTLFKQFGVRTMFSTLWKKDHSQKKRHIAGQYANTNVLHAEIVGGIQERVSAFVQKCIEFEGRSIDAYVYLHCFALDCASHFLFHPYGTHSIEKDEDLKMMEELSYHHSLKQNLAQYRWPMLSTIFEKVFKPRPTPLANDHVLESSKKPDVGEHTLAYKLQRSKEQFQQIEVAAECMDHLAAGIDTTGDALTFLMYQISLPAFSHVQARLIEEIQNQKRQTVFNLPYLDAVIKESLRCFPPIPMSQPRRTPLGGRTIDGYFIPGNVVVSCQAFSVHRFNEHVFVNGDDFYPERWLDPGGALEMNRLFFAFGSGGRGCTGKHLAYAEMKYLLQGVYSKFKTRIAPDMNGRMTLSDQVISSRPLDQTCKLMFEAIHIS